MEEGEEGKRSLRPAPSTPLVAFGSLAPSSPRQLGSQQKFPVRSRVRPSKPIPRSLTRSAVESSTTLTLFGLRRHNMSASNATNTTNSPYNSLPWSSRSSRAIIDGVSQLGNCK
jgi:hypothetical protein